MLKELMEQRSALVKRMREFNDKIDAEKRAYTAEEEASWKAMNADYDALKTKCDRASRLESLESEQARPADDQRQARDAGVGRDDAESSRADERRDPDADFRNAFAGWALARSKPSLLSDEHREAAKRNGVHLGDKEFTIRLNPDTETLQRRQRIFRSRTPDVAYEESRALEQRALSTQVGQLGGFTIAPNFNAAIESALLYYGPMLQVATPLRTSTAADYPMMTDNETTKTGSYVGENTAITTTEGVTINQVVFHAYKATTNAILVPYELLRDTSINLTAYLAAKLGERLGRFINTECTTGAIKAKGIVTGATAGVTTASSTAIVMDETLSLLHAVDVAYRNDPSFAFMFHDNILLALRKLKASGSGEYLWANGTQAGEPDRLWGKPYFVNNDMASTIATTNITMLAGAFAKYHVRTVGEIRLTMTEERYWEYDQTAFAGYMYFDGGLVDAGTHPVKKMAQA